MTIAMTAVTNLNSNGFWLILAIYISNILATKTTCSVPPHLNLLVYFANYVQ